MLTTQFHWDLCFLRCVSRSVFYVVVWRWDWHFERSESTRKRERERAGTRWKNAEINIAQVCPAIRILMKSACLQWFVQRCVMLISLFHSIVRKLSQQCVRTFDIVGRLNANVFHLHCHEIWCFHAFRNEGTLCTPCTLCVVNYTEMYLSCRNLFDSNYVLTRNLHTKVRRMHSHLSVKVDHN